MTVIPEVTVRRRGMAFCAPLIPGMEDQGRSFIQDAFSRPAMAQSRRALRQNMEVVTLVETPQGPVGAVYLEGVDPWEGNREFAASTSDLDTWFKSELTTIFPHAFYFGQRVPGVEEIFDSAALHALAAS